MTNCKLTPYLNVKAFLLMGLSAALTACMSPHSHFRHLSEAAKLNVYLGIYYLQHNQVNIAKQRFLLALKQAPRNASSWYGMGYFFEKTGQLFTAAQYYRYAIHINPFSAAAHNNYGIFLCHRHQYKQAIHQFKLAIKNPYYLGVTQSYENIYRCALFIHNQKRAKNFLNMARLGEHSSK